MVYIAEHLSFDRLYEMNIGLYLEAIWFKFSQSKSKKLLIGSIYSPPSSDISAFNSSLEKTLNHLKSISVETILLGDFNVDFSKTISTAKNLQRITKYLHGVMV